MKDKEQLLLNAIQREFPLVPEPYKALGLKVGLSSQEVKAALKQLKKEGILRQISAIFNPQALGYQTTLVAAAVEATRVEEAAQVINAYPGVSHNYLRNHYYNLWFTIAVPPGESLSLVVRNLLEKARPEDFLLLPIKRVFKIALILDLGEENNASSKEPYVVIETAPAPDPQTITLVKITQEDLPLVDRPFEAWGQKVSMSQEEIIHWIKKGLANGLIRRFAGLVRHQKAGFQGNIMVAWKVPEERVETVGQGLAQEKGITHCYERKTYPQWPYNIYTMLHARKQDKALAKVKELAAKYQIPEFLPLISLQEFKKVRLKLFWT